jgi:hypothetical protein
MNCWALSPLPNHSHGKQTTHCRGQTSGNSYDKKGKSQGKVPSKTAVSHIGIQKVAKRWLKQVEPVAAEVGTETSDNHRVRDNVGVIIANK